MSIPVGVRDLKIDKTTADLVVGNGDLVSVSGLDAIEQDLRLALGLFQGEWFLDETQGVPYYQSILGQKPSLLVVREIFRKQLLAVPGVLEVLALEVTYDRRTRKATVSWRVSSDLGELTGEKTV